ncbi:hypothetical protein L484_012312 [Morus notabilis]|uniref:Uncharacterized protein n=1 Tax=Morus notabilis TaxID=981085 RepID=W9QJC5_9ROSA|nr:hypothetical protein L484_012312 [Morus notabilis]
MPFTSLFSFQRSVLPEALPLPQSAQDNHRGMQRDVLEAYSAFTKFFQIKITSELPSFDLDEIGDATRNKTIKLRDQMQIKAAKGLKMI